MNTTDTIDTPHEAPATDDAGPGRTTAEIVYDAGTVVALLVGGFVLPVAGWVAGVVLLWNGPRWTVGWRWLGTLAWPVLTVLGLVLLFALPWEPARWIAAALAALALVAAHVGLAVVAARAGNRR